MDVEVTGDRDKESSAAGEQHAVSDKFGRKQAEGEDRQSELKPFGS